jgi:hypothetical protein
MTTPAFGHPSIEGNVICYLLTVICYLLSPPPSGGVSTGVLSVFLPGRGGNQGLAPHLKLVSILHGKTGVVLL